MLILKSFICHITYCISCQTINFKKTSASRNEKILSSEKKYIKNDNYSESECKIIEFIKIKQGKIMFLQQTVCFANL